ncbi:hypothetical protein AXF42_Ash001837 [Apostasia shenzhenica]|uniref:Uncharacterized protein n=1 Tax=Apostasia shenzhenica TaxID=1088818 RepID=A0A2I0ABH1_9ASPA|nr:hypothetical protein AXF42_Ash001837 [Apostasia shenzhenica]
MSTFQILFQQSQSEELPKIKKKHKTTKLNPNWCRNEGWVGVTYMFNPSRELFICNRYKGSSILHIFIAFQHFNERLTGELRN